MLPVKYSNIPPSLWAVPSPGTSHRSSTCLLVPTPCFCGGRCLADRCRLPQTDADADAKAMERAMRFWTLEFHDPILEMVSVDSIRDTTFGCIRVGVGL